MIQLKDRFDRQHNSLRMSLSEDNNYYCVYYNSSMSLKSKSDESEFLSFDNILKLIHIFVSELGINEIKFTGGEPLYRLDVLTFFKKLSEYNKENKISLGLTTNGILLYDKIELLQNYGINSININLNTLKKEKFKKIYPDTDLEVVLKSIDKAGKSGVNPLKINCTVMKGFNEDEIFDFVEFGKNRNINIRFIEFLPYTDDSRGSYSYISVEQIYKKINNVYPLVKMKSDMLDVAKNYQIKDFLGTLGFISSTSNHFCSSCNRLRITAEGNLLMCLFSTINKDVKLKNLLNSEKSDKEIANFISDLLFTKNLHHPDVEKYLLLNRNNVPNFKNEFKIKN
jgi:cyclic pyranopterin phosphate synthase